MSMKLYRFDIGTTHPVTMYGSERAAITRIVQVEEQTSAVCIYLGSGGLLAGHEAVKNQLYLVIAGRGWVRTKKGEPIALQMGQAAYWEAGEWHESGTHHGMVAMVLEGDDVNPEKYMMELWHEQK